MIVDNIRPYPKQCLLMPLARVGARTENTTCYSHNARRGQFPRTRIGIVGHICTEGFCTLVPFINPRCACAARVTVVGFVCLSVCLLSHTSLHE